MNTREKLQIANKHIIMKFKRGNKIGENTRFSAHNQPKNRGRKPSLYKKLKIATDEESISQEDLRIVLGYILICTPAELRSLIGLDGKRGQTMFDAEFPAWIVGIIVSLLTDIRYGRMNTVNMMLDRMFGKTGQSIEVHSTVNVKVKDFTNMTEEELIAESKELEKKLG